VRKKSEFWKSKKPFLSQINRSKNMKRAIDIDAILAPIPGDNPAGENLRYAPVYDEIKEARRADDPLDRGDWDREIKTSDWDKVIALSLEALTESTKDLQIAAWLAEALTRTEGFEGLIAGLKILTGFLSNFWDTVYPEIDEDDLDYRIGPLEFLNNNLWFPIKEVPVTDRGVTSGYSWLQWQESRQVGYEKDALNQNGGVDDSKKAARDEKIAEGKLPAEDFDGAVALSSKAFYVGLEGALASCVEEFKIFDQTVDEKFGNQAPRLSELKQSIQDCDLLISRILKKKREIEPDTEPEPGPEAESEAQAEGASEAVQDEYEMETTEPAPSSAPQPEIGAFSAPSVPFPSGITSDSDSMEQELWKDALNTLQASGVKEALTKLLNASCSATSVRHKNRYRLLIARLCLKAGRPDIARPVIEELHALIEQLGLEQWESPLWIAEVLDAYYQCLTSEGASDDDRYKANSELFQKLCTKDITKAIKYE
jgi:type VI secretion system protein ImpA